MPPDLPAAQDLALAQALDYASVFVFALTGGLAGSRARLDIVGFVFVACLTAVGGGTVRDVLLNRDAVFWVAEPAYIAVAAGGGLLVFVAAPFIEYRRRALVGLDAVALPVAVTAGLSVAVGEGAPPSVAIFMGVSTGCFGGLMRDVVCNEVPVVLRQGEPYVTAALLGAATGAGLIWSGTEPIAAYAACGLVTLAVRAASLRYGLRLPGYRDRPPRDMG